MAPIMDQVLKEVLSSCASSVGINKETEKKQKDQFSLDSDSDDEEVVGIDVDINFLDEKSSAVHTLGNLCLFSPSLTFPRIQEILDTLKEIEMYFHENIRYHVCLTYTQIAFGLLKHYTGNYDDKFKWQKGLPVQNPLPADVLQFIDTKIFAHFLTIFEDERNKEVIEKTIECIRDMCEEMGPGAIVNQIERIVNVILLLLDKKAFCQTKTKDFQGEVEEGEEGNEFEDEDQDDDNEEEEDEDDDIDHDEIILGNTTDLVISLSKALGNQFLTFLP